MNWRGFAYVNAKRNLVDFCTNKTGQYLCFSVVVTA